jgi:glycerophosphoryl diester phosphodiesterase
MYVSHLSAVRFALSIVVAFALPVLACAAGPTPLPRAHAHNDYEHPRPLLDALDHGFCSVEADIFLTKAGLLVAHDPINLRTERTLEALYLDPLRERVKQHGGHVYANDAPFYLMIDVKTDADTTYRALEAVLERYADMLTVTRDGKVEPNAVTVILSGNRAQKLIAAQSVRYVGIDGRPEDLDRNSPADLVPWISARWGSLFSWGGEGPMPADQKEKLNTLVRRAHDQGRKVRFWATPEKPELWNVLVAADVDFINTDRLDELRQLLSTQK